MMLLSVVNVCEVKMMCVSVVNVSEVQMLCVCGECE